MAGRIVTLHAYSAWGQGNHVQACINLLKGMVGAGGDVHLDLPRSRVDMGAVPYRASIPWPINRFGLPRLEPALRRMSEKRFLARLRDEDVAWLWPDISLEVFETVKRRGNPIILECVNTRVSAARDILARAYAADSLTPPSHLTDEKVRYDEASLGFADFAFAASPAIETSLRAQGSSFNGTILPTSYGAWMTSPAAAVPPRKDDQPLTVLFVGTLSVRKNVHGLLRAWAAADTKEARLVLVGPMTPEVEQLCEPELSLPSVDVRRGFFSPLDPFYQMADVFVIPSFEEGDPQVTYEAANFGLPIIGSAMGGGRMAARSDAVCLIDPWEISTLADALTRFIADADMRAEFSARTRAASKQFDWLAVGGDRYAQIAQQIFSQR